MASWKRLVRDSLERAGQQAREGEECQTIDARPKCMVAIDMSMEPVLGPLPGVAGRLLGQLLEEALRSGGSVPATKYRSDNYSLVEQLDELEAQGHLRQVDSRYVIASASLPLLENDDAKRLMSSIERMYEAIQKHYRLVQEKQLPVHELAGEAGVSMSEALTCLNFMLDNTLWSRGHSLDLSSPGGFVIPSEGVLKYATFRAATEQVRIWRSIPSSLPRSPSVRSERAQVLAKPDLAPGDRTRRGEPISQMQSLDRVLDELSEMEFSLNDYYDDAEPQGVIDNVLSGKISTLRAYVAALGWSELVGQLRDLTPLQGNAVEALELVKNFVIPEGRRLIAVEEAKKQNVLMTSVLRAWPAVRACLQALSFYDIKEVTGLAGLNVTALAHLVQKPERGATKGQLMTAVDAEFAKMAGAEQRRFLTILVEEILRRKPDSQEQLSEYLTRLGWAFVGETLIPLQLLDPEDLAQTPDVSHADLRKAAQRFRDGDLTGAISAACAAVDSATAQVYQQKGVGDVTQASFQERCRKAAFAKGVLTELDGQLEALGWQRSELVPFRKNLEGALNQGAYVMQTLRSQMGDVHGSKPILTSLVFDSLKWAELIVGSLVERSEVASRTT